MRTRSQARRRRQPQVRQTSVESSNLEKPDNPPIVLRLLIVLWRILLEDPPSVNVDAYLILPVLENSLPGNTYKPEGRFIRSNEDVQTSVDSNQSRKQNPELMLLLLFLQFLKHQFHFITGARLPFVLARAISFKWTRLQKYTADYKPYDGSTKSTSLDMAVMSISRGPRIFQRDRVGNPTHILSLLFSTVLQISLLSGTVIFFKWKKQIRFLALEVDPIHHEVDPNLSGSLRGTSSLIEAFFEQ
ncbi:hypothetical protein Tco_1079881 [Tanacetum coccineum]|uniref:Uncharacterized protein n=1 Tax=Tanacetum coccineum TaxID=301880 RepID=A0ABQ5HT36_9ASTR